MIETSSNPQKEGKVLSRESSPIEPNNEPQVQFVNDSEFSSPRNDEGFSGSAIEYIPEKPPLFVQNLKYDGENIADDTLQYAKTPSVVKSHKMLNLGQHTQAKREEIKFEQEIGQQNTDLRNFSKSMIDVKKSPITQKEDSKKRDQNVVLSSLPIEKVDNTPEVTKFSDNGNKGLNRDQKSASSLSNVNKDAASKKCQNLKKTIPNQRKSAQSFIKPQIQPRLHKDSSNSSFIQKQQMIQGQRFRNSFTHKAKQPARPETKEDTVSGNGGQMQKTLRSSIKTVKLNTGKSPIASRTKSNGLRDKDDTNSKKGQSSLKIDTLRTSQKLFMSPRVIATEITNLETACVIPSNYSVLESNRGHSPKSPMTIEQNYHDTKKIIEGDIRKDQNIFYENSNNIKVVIRVRPFNDREKADQSNKSCVTIENNGTEIELDRGVDTKKFNFDFVGHENIDQQSIFNQIAKPIADSCLQGYNGTIFAYGQTGAGKTFTIQGPSLFIDQQNQISCQDQPVRKQDDKRGIMQRSFEYIFKCIESEKSMIDEKANGSALSFLVKCSFLEIYNEQIMDLLEPSQVNLNIREDINRGVYVEGLCEETVTCHQDMLALIDRGANNRHVGATSMNRQSSRSHSLLTTIIESKSRTTTGVWNVKQSNFHIIDLAGSERQKVANTMGDRLKEASAINKSLSALGNVINSLVDVSEGRNRHVPYRDSKLTFILRDSLGGNSKTAIIANISPSNLNFSETHSTLKFAQRAKLIRNKAVINEDSSGTMILLKNEIKQLKRDLNEQIKQVSVLQTEKNEISEQLVINENNKKSQEHALCENCRKEIKMKGDNQNSNSDELLDGHIVDQINNFELSQMTVSQGRPSEEFKFQGDRHSDPSAIVYKGISRIRSSNVSQIPSQFGLLSPKTSISRVPHERQSSMNHTGKIKAPSSINGPLKNIYTPTQLTDRLIYLEQILTQNMLEHTTYLQELADLRTKNKLLEEALDTTMKENVQLRNVVESKSLGDTEIVYLKEIIKKQIDQEQVPEILRLNAEIEGMKAKCREYQSGHNNSGELSPSMMMQQQPPKDNNYIEQLEVERDNQAKVIKDLNNYFTQNCKVESYLDLAKDLQKSKSQLAVQQQQSKDQLEELQMQYDTLQDQNMQLDASLQETTREYGRSKVEIQSLKEIVRSHEQEMHHNQEEKKILNNHILQFQNNLAQSQHELSEKQTVIQKLNEEDAYTKIIIQEMKTQSEQNSQTIAQKDKELQCKTQEVESIQNLIETMNLAKQQIENSKESLDDELVQLQQKLSTLTNDLDQKQTEMQSIQISSQQKQEQLEEDRSIKQNQIDDLQKLINEKEEHIKNVKQIIVEKEETIKMLENEKEQITNKLQTVDETRESLSEDKSKLQEDIYNMQQRNDKLNELIQQKDDQIKQKENELLSSNALLVSKEKTNEQISQNLGKVKLELSMKTDELSTVNMSLSSQTHQSEQKIAEVFSTNEDLKGQMESLRKQVQGQEDLIKQSHQTMNQNREQSRRELDDYSQRLQEQICKNQDLSMDLQQTQDQKQNLEDNLSKRSQELKILEQKLDITEQRLKDKTAVHDTVQGQLKESREKEQHLNDQIRQRLDEFETLKVEHSKVCTDTQTFQSQVDTLIKENISFKDAKQIQGELAFQLQKEVMNLKEDIYKKEENLNEKLQQKEQKIEYFMKATEEQKQEKEHTCGQICQLENQVEQQSHTVKKLESEQESLLKEVDGYKSQIQTIQKNIDMQKEQNHGQQLIITQKTNLLQGTQDELKACQQLIEEQEGFILTMKQNLDDQLNQNTSLQTQKNSNDQKLKQVQNDLKQMEEKVHVLTSTHQESEGKLLEQKDKLKFEVEDKDQKIENMSATISDLTEQIEVKKEELKQQNIQVENYSRESQEISVMSKQFAQKAMVLGRILDMLKTACAQKQEQIQKVEDLESVCERIDNEIGNISDSDEEKQLWLLICSKFHLIIKKISVLFEQVMEKHQKDLEDQKKQSAKELEQLQQSVIEKECQIQTIKEKVSSDVETYSQQIKFQKDKVSTLQALQNKIRKEFENKQKEFESNQSNLNQQNQEKEKVLKEVEQKQKKDSKKIKESQGKMSLLEKQLTEEIDQKQQLIQELDGYKTYLPEAENLLQEVNKRHMVTQKQLDQSVQDNAKLNEKLEVLKDELQKEKQKNQRFEKQMEDNMTNQETKFDKVQQQVSILANNEKQVKKERDLLVIELESFQKQDKVNKEEIEDLKNKIHSRESEMREVVKTLKQFSQDKKRIEKDNEKLRDEIQVLTGAQNHSYKIQLLMKIKEDNNTLREENYKLFSDLQRKEEIVERYQRQEQMSQTHSDKDLTKQLFKHLDSLQNIQRMVCDKPLNPQQNLPSQLIEFLSILDDALKNPSICPDVSPQTTQSQHQKQRTRNLNETMLSKNLNYLSGSKEDRIDLNADNTINYIPQEIQRPQLRISGTADRKRSSNNHSFIQNEAGLNPNNYNYSSNQEAPLSVRNNYMKPVSVTDSSPIILNSYQSIYKRREQSRESLGSKKSTDQKSAERYRNEQFQSHHNILKPQNLVKRSLMGSHSQSQIQFSGHDLNELTKVQLVQPPSQQIQNPAIINLQINNPAATFSRPQVTSKINQIQVLPRQGAGVRPLSATNKHRQFKQNQLKNKTTRGAPQQSQQQ